VPYGAGNSIVIDKVWLPTGWVVRVVWKNTEFPVAVKVIKQLLTVLVLTGAQIIRRI